MTHGAALGWIGRDRNPHGIASPAMASRRLILVAAVLAGCTFVSAPAPAMPVPAYHATALGTLGGATSEGTAINAAGDVTGNSRTPTGLYAFIYSGGTMHNLGAIGSGTATRSFGRAINDAGDVTGWVFNCSPFCGSHGFLYSGGRMTQLPPIFTSSIGHGINNAGQIAGEAEDVFPVSPRYAFIYLAGTMTRLGTLGGTTSRAHGINGVGQVAGVADLAGNARHHAFLYSGGTMQDLGTLGGASSTGYAINASGQVTGVSDISGNARQHAFLYSGGTMADLGTLGGITSTGFALDSSGRVAGTSTAADGRSLAFLHANGVMYDLNALVVSGLGGAMLTEARAINDRGQIVANACGTAGCLAYRLEPLAVDLASMQIPALSNLAMFALATLLLAGGLSGLKWTRRRRRCSQRAPR
jgi:probable HAF family extracellular repeat protein